MTGKKSVLVLFSGGLDSTILVKHYLDKGWDVSAVFFDYSQPWLRKELYASRVLAESLRIVSTEVDVGTLGYKKFFVPVRNVVLLANAVNLAYSHNIKNVAYGACHGEYLDVRPEFVDRFNFMLEYCLKEPIYVLAPFANWSKERLIKYGIKIGAPLHLTHSCMESPSCGKCLACRLRKKYGIAEG